MTTPAEVGKVGIGHVSTAAVEQVPATVEAMTHFIDQNFRPFIEADGGSIIVVDYEDDILRIQLKGSCSGCGASKATLKHLQDSLKKKFKGLDGVEVVL